MDIRTKLVLALVSSALLSMALLGYLGYLLTFELYLQDSSRQIASIANHRIRQIDHRLGDWQQTVSGLLARGEYTSVPASGTQERAPQQTLNRLFSEAKTFNPDVSWISLYGATGARYMATNPEVPANKFAPHEGIRIAGVQRTRGGSVSIVLTATAGDGVLAVGFDAGALADAAEDLESLGTSASSFLVASSWYGEAGEARSGFLILNPPAGLSAQASEGELPEAPAIVADALAATDADLLESEFLDAPVFASVRTLQQLGWRLVVKVNADAELARIDELLAQMRSLGLSLGALVIFGGIFFGAYLARRIRSLAETVERIRHGELDLRAEVQGSDEVALLARSLNEFMDQLDRSSDLFQLGALRVLVVESQSGNRHLLNELLTNWRMRALLVTSGSSALEAVKSAEQAGDPVQLMVLDESLPEMDGMKLLEQLAGRKDWTRCPIIMLSKDPSSLDREKLKRMGVGHLLELPVVASDLMEAILEEMGVSAAALDSVADADVFLTKVPCRRILLAEDSPIIQRVTMGFLDRWGHSVRLVGNGRQAVEAFESEDFDLVLMDLEMPEMNGLDAAIEIRALEKLTETRTPIIALTARATKAAREECMAAGMDDYLAKPVDPKVLYRLIDSHPARVLGDGATASVRVEQKMGEDGSEEENTRDIESGDLIDWQKARALTDGDKGLLEALVELFPQESANHLEEIRAGLDAGDAEGVTRGAHSLKNAAGFFGAEKLVASALAVENLGRESNLEAAAGCLAELKSETARLTAALRESPPPE